MSDYLKPVLDGDIRGVSSLGLAHVGDAVFELMVRTWVCMRGASTARGLHKGTVEFVSAKAQAAALERILPELCQEELAVYKRGRNAHISSSPRSSSHEEYHAATGIEALFGYLYLSGNTERLNVLFKLIID